ncbi:MAG: hypothetical protein L6R40_006648 [Gallowayella cf. fulva]|nr:MAG: hypothetical protein L6R40_006648 [Xanthomendoza cf. fulva]
MFATAHIFSDPSLLSNIRTELKGAIVADEPELRFDLTKLLQLPLLRSVYCETLRLNVDAYIMRYTDRADLHIGEWTFPKDSVVLTTTGPPHTDETVWNSGRSAEHPIEQFWAERFLVYPGDVYSGPIKATRVPGTTSKHLSGCNKEAVAHQPGKARFSTAGTAGHWIPYGGGERICPGRHLAKRGILTTCALMVTMFDIEIRAPKTALRADPAYSGFGSQRPAKEVPFRIRRRQNGVGEDVCK